MATHTTPKKHAAIWPIALMCLALAGCGNDGPPETILGATPEGDDRAFRVDRVSELRVGEEAGVFVRPDQFDADKSIPDAPWEAGGEDLEAEVVFDADVAWWARREMSTNATVTEAADGSVRATIPIANRDAFVGWILGFVDQAEVLGPPELRDQVVARAMGSA